jgi:hypothetical protein
MWSLLLKGDFSYYGTEQETIANGSTAGTPR